MNPSPSCLRKLNYSLLAVCSWISIQGLALAAEASDSGGGSSGGVAWVLPYAFVILCIGLGMFILCRSARRKERARPEQYEKISLIDQGDADEAVVQEKRHGVKRAKQECKEAKTALLFSILGVLLCVPLCIVGIIQGIKARKIIAGDRRLTGDGQALAAIIIGATWLFVCVLVFLMVIVSMMGAVSAVGDAVDSLPEPPAAEAEAEP